MGEAASADRIIVHEIIKTASCKKENNHIKGGKKRDAIGSLSKKYGMIK